MSPFKNHNTPNTQAGLPFRPAGRRAGRLVLLALLLALLPACIPLTGDLPAQKTADRSLLTAVQNSGRLVIATETDYPPQSRLVPGQERAADTLCDLPQYTANQFEGFDVDVAVELARRLGVEPCFVTPSWSQLVGGNWGGRWDVSVGSMAITTERMNVLYFTQPYTSGSAVLFAHADNTTFEEPRDFSGRRIGVCTGCAYESYLNHTLEIPGLAVNFQIQDAVVVGYDTDTSALADLALGDGLQLDAVLTDPDTGRIAIENGLPIRQVGEPLYYDYVSIAVDKNASLDSLPLVLRLTEIVQAMHQDGTLSRLSEQYYQADFTAPAAGFDIQALEQIP